jgi:beta-N-acetylhexosaminidase
MAQELQQHGINLNFAPIVDINNSSAPCEVIGKMDRSYGEEPEKVINYSQVFIDAHHECNTITCLKHFPGHGFVKGDSHLGMVDATSTASEVELIPYYRLIKEGKVDAIMTAHVVNKNLDPNYPATLSQVTLKKLLREQGYDGVIISDDLFMGAIVEHYELENSIQLAISAGCDMLIFSYNEAAYKKAAPNFVPPENIFETVVETVMQAISEGTITVAQIDDAYRRISTLKSKFLV